MPGLEFIYREAGNVPENRILEKQDALEDEISSLRKVLKAGYGSEYASINLPFDEGMLKKVENTVREKNRFEPEILVVAGIGGSNLGTIAVHEALNTRFHNELSQKPRVYFADTVDPDKIHSIKKICVETLDDGGKILLNAVTKSGSTTETITVFEHFRKLLEKYEGGKWPEYAVATTGSDSGLRKYAEKTGMAALEIPDTVGGRYSVLSPVGLFPLGMLGVKLKELRRGAADAVKDGLNKKINSNNPAVSAILLYEHFKSGKNICDTFLFSTDLESVGKWYRQLMGESVGKKYSKSGKLANSGMTPTVSIGSTDLHSMAQLYLGGPKDKYTAFIWPGRTRHDQKSPSKGSGLLEQVQGKNTAQILEAIYEGVKTAYVKNSRPFSEIRLEDKSEYSIGYLLQFKMLEIIYLARLLDVNPFDQPRVEDYKQETRKILGGTDEA